jgi:mannose-6-phosphate isomerase-like protein (cupin superfamily)
MEERPWGQWRVIWEEPDNNVTVKVLIVNPGCMLSLQSHQHRIEEWLPLSDGLIKYTPSMVFSDVVTQHNSETMEAGTVYKIYTRQQHRLINPTKSPITVIETIRGKYDEDDIIRYHDAYGRE